MPVFRHHFPSRIPDNEEAYFSLLQGVVEGEDPLVQLQLTYAATELHVRIVPSTSLFLDSLLRGVNGLHNLLHLRVTWSKSMKTSVTLQFSLSY